MSIETLTDGRHAFDFLPGRWHIRNRKLRDVLDPDCTEWVEFDAVSTAWQTLGGLGNVDTFVTDDYPGIGSYQGMSMRLFEPETGHWKIWWASTRLPGRLDPPVVGTLVDGRGDFLCDDELAGRPIKVRFRWTVRSNDSLLWVQAFSHDGGETWADNWIMESSRID
ncbi:hypothetical protein EV193_11838 [Herbihabitans rhizosphaerae]|uniref:DUF1579 domain-containing protein n=1 Tax=Herbihabitans rhizosphaerae TaxID=1872711 RepID=A0A4Q7KC61_9PSEU|nr:hypothetical protein [Herbihabitans rhizosphaerae]RZS29784.1 hypothetical protein EV193_11838 [Herbihabitans rhizosphaerae]